MIRNTIQRVVVYDTVNKLKNHATAEEIYNEVRRTNPHISKGTVYRNLNRLCDDGKIKRRRMPGEADRFDHICSEHYHGKCLYCGQIMDLDIEYLPHLDSYTNMKNGFQVISHDIVFSGICVDCKDKSFPQNGEDRDDK